MQVEAQNLKTTISVSVVHGTKKGPVLGITAGVHEYKYLPILAGHFREPKIAEILSKSH